MLACSQSLTSDQCQLIQVFVHLANLLPKCHGRHRRQKTHQGFKLQSSFDPSHSMQSSCINMICFFVMMDQVAMQLQTKSRIAGIEINWLKRSKLG